MEKTRTSVQFDSSGTGTGLDFIARSLAQREINGTPLCPDSVTGNMNDEQKAIFLARLSFHQSRLKRLNPGH
ncbi:hypothetical protein [Citrobacter werkmanii]|uniref:hypothetical protein n=1 Tax=Citrobacter werkmanii TaxID=67827 RepID=UPI002656F262|nr:hypothetical protein [Citrobacter werkmanii]MDN8559089.1 hypothetical protein [Citrobacter werkmanii]